MPPPKRHRRTAEVKAAVFNLSHTALPVSAPSQWSSVAGPVVVVVVVVTMSACLVLSCLVLSQSWAPLAEGGPGFVSSPPERTSPGGGRGGFSSEEVGFFFS